MNIAFCVHYASGASFIPVIQAAEYRGIGFRIIVLRDKNRTLEAQSRQIFETVAYFKETFGWSPVIEGPDTSLEFLQQFDYFLLCNPYEEMSSAEFFPRNLKLANSRAGIGFIHYTYSVSKLDLDTLSRPYFLSIDDVFVPNEIIAKEILEKGCPSRIYITGYPKLDPFICGQHGRAGDLCFLICLHHSIGQNRNIKLGAYNYFRNHLTLVFLYFTNIRFILRPHPLFWDGLRDGLGWSESQVASERLRLQSFANVELDLSESYLEAFKRSTALIHDCGSFMAEYLCENKPMFFMRRPDIASLELNKVGELAQEAHTVSSSCMDLITFVCDVIENIDNRASRRLDVIRDLSLNESMYPAAPRVLHQIQQSVRGRP